MAPHEECTQIDAVADDIVVHDDEMTATVNDGGKKKIVNMTIETGPYGLDIAVVKDKQ